MRWEIGTGDPAAPVMRSLRKKGFDYLVLPRYTLVTGLVLSSVPSLPPLREDNPAHLIRAVRLQDCLHALGIEPTCAT